MKEWNQQDQKMKYLRTMKIVELQSKIYTGSCHNYQLGSCWWTGGAVSDVIFQKQAIDDNVTAYVTAYVTALLWHDCPLGHAVSDATVRVPDCIKIRVLQLKPLAYIPPMNRGPQYLYSILLFMATDQLLGCLCS